MSRRGLLAVVAALVVLTGGGCSVVDQAVDHAGDSRTTDTSTSAASSTSARDPDTGLLSDDAAAAAIAAADPATALAALAVLPVQGRAPRTGYDRDQFGAGWVDTDRNGCDTRNDVLARDLLDETFKPDTRDCVVATGTLADPYSGTTIAFVRGEGTSELVQIDHVVPLSNSWQTGAQGWDADTRAAFANDPRNLLAVDGTLNQQKSDGDAATWLPPNRAFRCAYVARQIAVKAGYGLWTTPAEHTAMATILAGCPDEPLPTAAASAAPAAVPTPAVPTPAVPTAAVPTPEAPPAPAEGPFENCAAARAAGAAPVRTGDPGYGPGLDGDGDGIACE